MNLSVSRALLIPFVLVCFTLSSQTRADCQQGCGGSLLSNTFLGANALINNTSGFNNTAMGYAALADNPSGTSNTATGAQARYFDTTGTDNTTRYSCVV
jgi:hypothetical protein